MPLFFSISILLSVLATKILGCETAYAKPDAEKTYALRSYSGTARAYSGGGTAHIADLSAIELNPAGLAQTRQVLIQGEYLWTNDNGLFAQAGVVDSMMSETAAGFLVRQTTEASGAKDLKATLGMAHGVPESNLIMGIGGDYIKYGERIDPESPDLQKVLPTPEGNFRLRLGAIMPITQNLQIGLRSEGYFDKIDTDKQHAVGASTSFLGHFIAGLDFVANNKELTHIKLDGAVQAKTYLGIMLGYSYGLLNEKLQGLSGGLTLHSDSFSVFYTLSKDDLKATQVVHSAGASMALSF